MEEENNQSDEQKAEAENEQKAVVIEEDDHFKGEILTAEQNQLLKRLREKLFYSESFGVGNNAYAYKYEISWLRIGAIGAIKLKRCLASNQSIFEEDGAYIGSKGCKIISQANWPELQTLQLYQNQICQVGARHLSKAQWKNLTFLHLGINFLRLEGFRFLIRCSLVNLQQLYIYNNEFSPEVFGLYAQGQWNELNNLHTEINGIPEKYAEKAKQIIKNRFPKASTICI